MQLKTGTFFVPELQAGRNKLGAAQFTFEIMEVLKEKDGDFMWKNYS
ncbi:MAG: hypothetical protein LLG37_11205 [Spirochaetia bacterium]|nr:hypothetical protein [Spirochaetia bacterium]